MKSILDRSFRYTSSANTDIRKLFAKVRREQREIVAAEEQSKKDSKVAPIRGSHGR